MEKSEPIIGYSAYRLFEECYVYNEDACYIADTPDSLNIFLEEAMLSESNYRIRPVYLKDIMNDFGSSGQEYAMEPEVLKRFKHETDVDFATEPFDDPFNEGESDLFIVKLDKKNRIPFGDINDKIHHIMSAFRIFDGEYKKEHIDAAIELKEEITPHLIQTLQNVLKDPDKYIENENLYDHIYSVMLLGHFREPDAHKVIVDIFSLPNEKPYDLFGDMTTSDLPVILLRTCGGTFDLIKSMALNRDANDYCRISALHAMAFAVVEGILSREDVLAFLGSLFTGDEADEGSDFWGLLACNILDLYPEEYMDIIKTAYEDELIFSGIVNLKDFDKVLKKGKEKCLKELKTDLERNSLDDIHSCMDWWACFNEEQELSFSSIDAPANSALSAPYKGLNKKLNTKKTKKKKRKKAKASKRKNRRK